MAEALASANGIIVSTNNAEILLQRLYSTKAAHEEFAGLAIEISRFNPSSEVWIIKKEAVDAAKKRPD